MVRASTLNKGLVRKCPCWGSKVYLILFSVTQQKRPSSLLRILDCRLRANAECGDHPEVSHKLPPGFIKSSFSHLFAGAPWDYKS